MECIISMQFGSTFIFFVGGAFPLFLANSKCPADFLLLPVAKSENPVGAPKQGLADPRGLENSNASSQKLETLVLNPAWKLHSPTSKASLPNYTLRHTLLCRVSVLEENRSQC